jgi:hypothetical protein
MSVNPSVFLTCKPRIPEDFSPSSSPNSKYVESLPPYHPPEEALFHNILEETKRDYAELDQRLSSVTEVKINKRKVSPTRHEVLPKKQHRSLATTVDPLQEFLNRLKEERLEEEKLNQIFDNTLY